MKGLQEYAESDPVGMEAVREINIDGHDVAWVRLTGPREDQAPSYALMCECDVAFEIKTVTHADGTKHQVRHRSGDAFYCPYKKAAQALRANQLTELNRGEFNRNEVTLSWLKKEKSLKDWVAEYATRVFDGEWMGNSTSTSIYAIWLAKQIFDDRPTELMRVFVELANDGLFDTDQGYTLWPRGSFKNPLNEYELPDKPEVIWTTTTDDGYKAEVIRTGHSTGQLRLVKADYLLLEDEEVTLMFSARFGPDVSDISDWIGRCEEAIKKHEEDGSPS